jgi:hypothetical protein
MKGISVFALVLALLLPACQSPNNTAADNKAIVKLQGRGFQIIDGIIGRFVPIGPVQPSGFAK